ncbi:MAG: peptidoglycan DD-metalloendopeptidase family protein [Bacteroidetes bacterium]|nr:peptidoglycan DD-metalloendopeptidase family protein [Bacteroidota bacterium]
MKIGTTYFRSILYMIFCSSIFIFSFQNTFSQTQKKKDLENKKQELQKEIEYKNKLLEEVKKNKNRSMVQLAILNSKIARQQELISTINKELDIIEGDISETTHTIRLKETELKILKDDYARIISASYKNRDAYSRLMFLFASADFAQAYQRIKYLQYYSEARKKQAGMIEDNQRQLQTKKQELEIKKEQRSKSLGEKEIETGMLSKQKKVKEVVLTDLQAKEKDIRAEIKKKKEQAEKLRKAIEKVIDDQIRKSRLSVKGDIKKITLTPEEKELSDNFESNKGKLPWPLAEGVVTESFGTHDHPDLPGIKVSNNGIDIGTNKGASVRSVFGGTVVAVASVGGIEGKVIIIKHGEYMSVYSNIEEAFVKSGEKIKTKQPIGKVLTDDNSGTALHFEIWKGQSMLNPESWIVK